MDNICDVLIIGAGAAGLSAALYCSRAKLSTVLLEKDSIGGQAVSTDEIENYPGAIENCTGPRLIYRMKEQAESFGTIIVRDEVIGVDFNDTIKIIKCKKETYEARTVIIATGAYPRLAGFKNELEYRGRGVSYCATCDGDFYTGLNIAVIGGGDSALTEAIYLTRFAEKITIIHRRDAFRAAKYLIERAENNSKINFMLDTVVEEAKGSNLLEKLIVKNVKTNEIAEIEKDGCFVFVGYSPVSELFRGKVNMNSNGEIIVGKDMETNVKGVFAAGDITEKRLRQIVTAAADGAIAATAAEIYIENNFVK